MTDEQAAQLSAIYQKVHAEDLVLPAHNIKYQMGNDFEMTIVMNCNCEVMYELHEGNVNDGMNIYKNGTRIYATQLCRGTTGGWGMSCNALYNLKIGIIYYSDLIEILLLYGNIGSGLGFRVHSCFNFTSYSTYQYNRRKILWKTLCIY